MLLTRLQVQLVLERKRGDGSTKGKEKKVKVSNNNDGSLVRNGATVEVSESAPLLHKN